jgi:hypothetical protein
MNTSNSYRPGNALKLLPPTTSQSLTQRPTNDLTPTILSPDRLLHDLLSRLFNRRHQLGLQSRGMDAVGVQTFVDELSADHPVRERVVGCEDVGGGERFVLRESPDVELVDGKGAADLGVVSLGVLCLGWGEGRTFSRSCLTSSRLTPRGMLSRRIWPLLLTVVRVSDRSWVKREGELPIGNPESVIMIAMPMPTAGSA